MLVVDVLLQVVLPMVSCAVFVVAVSMLGLLW
jgi:hypothetical protein